MSLLTYTDARPWAKSIKNAVVTRKMPPWFADPDYGHFANDRTLSQADIDTLVAWADNGAPEGDAKDKPAPLTFQDGWKIKPDMVDRDAERISSCRPPAPSIISTSASKVAFPRMCGCRRRRCVRATRRCCITARPGWCRPDRNGWRMPRPAWPYEGRETGRNDGSRRQRYSGQIQSRLGRAEFRHRRLGEVRAEGIGHRVRAALHGRSASPPRIGPSWDWCWRSIRPTTRYFLSADPRPESGDSGRRRERRSGQRSDRGAGRRQAGYVQPHMHLRGKDFELRAIYPTGESETLFKGKFDFNWQMGYDFDKPIPLPEGHASDRDLALRQLRQ